MSLRSRLAIIAGLFTLDRLSKYWAVHWLMAKGSMALLPFFHLTYVENTGAAFGIGFKRNSFFIALTSALLCVLFYLQKVWKDKNIWVQAGLVLVSAGAIGNLYDRLAYGYVIDYLDFRVWPVFNIADSCVTIGACLMAWGMRNEK